MTIKTLAGEFSSEAELDHQMDAFSVELMALEERVKMCKKGIAMCKRLKKELYGK